MAKRRVLLRDVNAAAAAYQARVSLYGEREQGALNAFATWQERRQAYEKQTGQKLYGANPPRPRKRKRATGKARRNPVRAADRERGELSESLALENVLTYLATRHHVATDRQERADIAQMASQLQQLGRQIKKGLHTNPPLLLIGNPPLKLDRRIPRGGAEDGRPLQFDGDIGRRVVELRYEHVENRKLYRHVFEYPAQLYAVTREGRRALFIGSRHHLWNDF
jgi:hypothetical protein